MSQNQINELALAREMQLMFNNLKGFTPSEEGIHKWQGSFEIDTPTDKLIVPIEILIPLKYPQYPPRVIIKNKAITHPNVEKDGNVLLRITHDWKPDTHVYQVVQALRELFVKVPPKLAGEQRTVQQKATLQSIETAITPQKREVEDVNATITTLQEKIKLKEEELTKIRGQLVRDSSEKVSQVEDINMLLPSDKTKKEKIITEAQSAALADLLSTLDEKFKDGEINPVDFAKLYRRYTKELYLINKQLEEM